MCDRQESRLYGQNFQGDIFATSVAISQRWKPTEKKGEWFRILFLGGKALLFTSVSTTIHSRKRRGGGSPNLHAFSSRLRSELFFVQAIALIGNPADAFQDRAHSAIRFQNPGHLYCVDMVSGKRFT